MGEKGSKSVVINTNLGIKVVGEGGGGIKV